MTPLAQHWLTLVITTWTVTSLAVLAAMLDLIVEHRRRPGGDPVSRVGALLEVAWIAVPVTIVVLMVVLAVRLQDAAPDAPGPPAASPAAGDRGAPERLAQRGAAGPFAGDR